MFLLILLFAFAHHRSLFLRINLKNHRSWVQIRVKVVISVPKRRLLIVFTILIRQLFIIWMILQFIPGVLTWFQFWLLPILRLLRLISRIFDLQILVLLGRNVPTVVKHILVRFCHRFRLKSLNFLPTSYELILNIEIVRVDLWQFLLILL